jgi:hypothetical protein
VPAAHRIGIIAIQMLIAAGPARQNLDCAAPVWGDTVPAFDSHVKAYVALRDRLERELRQPVTTEDSAATGSAQRALAARIRAARASAKQGDLFTAAITVEIKKSLRREIDAHSWQVIMDEDNPGEIPSQVNDEYREGKPLSTMPPNILAALPKLADDIEYRFVERHLILLDTRAKVIVDRIPYAIGDLASAGACR